MTVAVIGQFRIPQENIPVIRPMMRDVMAASRCEAGCIEYNYAEDMLEPGLIRVSEVWESRACLTAHLDAPHMAVWREQRDALGLFGRKMSVFEVSTAEDF